MNDYFFFSAPQLKRDPLDSAMKTVLSTTDHSLVESLRLALDAEGIQAVVQNDAGSPLPMIPITVLVQDADYDRAHAVATNLEEGTA